MIYDITKQKSKIPIGRVGENQYRSIEMDLSTWLSEYPNGKISAVFSRPDGNAYPVSLSVAGTLATWNIVNTDVAYAGIGEIQLTLRVGEMIAKSAIFETITDRSIDSDLTPPEDAKNWLDELIESSNEAYKAAKAANTAAQRANTATANVKDGAPGADGRDGITPHVGTNGNWYLGDEDTGVKAQGEDGKDGADGQDGYTPIKGVDYFDGKDGQDGINGRDGADGYTPVKGVDYFDGTDGKDGYTPIKGVDYFDGVDGKDGTNGKDGINGKDGKDGYTPVKGIDYFDGINGKDGVDGYTPVKGVDYFDGRDGTNGTDGIPATHSWNGTTLTITSASGTSSADLKGDTGETGATGANGQDGYTPVKGVDYFTEADKEELIAAVIESLGGSPIFGYVDENNNIVVSGSLSDGTYSVKYEMADGSTVDIGNLVLDSTVYYSITNSLANCTINNSATEIAEGESYSAAITANDGYELKSIAVTMGGEAVSVTDGVISIANVTGDIVITAVAEEIQVAEPVTVNIGITEDYSIQTDTGELRSSTSAGFGTTDFIDVSNIPKPCTINLTGGGWAYDTSDATGYVRFYVADTSGNKLAGEYTHLSKMPSGVTMVYNDDARNDVTVTVTSDTIGKLRFAGIYGSSGNTAGTGNFDDMSATLTYTPIS